MIHFLLFIFYICFFFFFSDIPVGFVLVICLVGWFSG